jgi:nitrite reductase/ring-hydroxylating ferredoxin subunit
MSDYFIMRAKEAMGEDIPATLPLSQVQEGQFNLLLLPDGNKAILIRRGEQMVAYLAVCPHMGGDLTLGSYCAKSQRIACCWHGYRFDATSGAFCENPNVECLKPLRTPSAYFDPDRQVRYRLQSLDIRIDGGQVSVDYKAGA